MNEATWTVGIDVSKKKLDVAVLLDGKVRNKTVDNTPQGYRALIEWLVSKGLTSQGSHICLEATGAYSESVAIFLCEANWPVSVVNPARIKGFAQVELARNKTDRADAALLARFCLAMRPDLWTPPAPEWRELRGWVDRLQALKDMRQQELNRIEAYGASGQASLMDAVHQHVDWLNKQIEKLERDIDDHIDRHPNLSRDSQLLDSIPGIGPATVAKVLAYAGDIRRFTNAKALAAFIGVTPKQRLSGSSVKGHTTISRTGHGDLRKALYMPGMVSRRHNPALKVFGDRLAARGLAPKAVIGACMRKLAHIMYGVIHSGTPFDLNIALPALDLQDGI